MKHIFPNVIVFGGMRCGTTSLYRYLSSHPDVFSSSQKELDVFYYGLNDSSDEIARKYRDIFAKHSGDESILLEASPRYARKHADVARKISQTIPDIKVIYLIRDPIERILSVYKAINRAGHLLEEVSFDQFVVAMRKNDKAILTHEEKSYEVMQELELGLYVPILNSLLEVFDKDQLVVECLENLSENPQLVMENICNFIGIDHSFYSEYSFSVENPSMNVKWPKLYKTALNVNRELEPLLNRFPKVRAIVRDAHHALNRSDNADHVSLDSLMMLEKYYSCDKSELSSLVKRLGISSIPDWLVRKE